MNFRTLIQFYYFELKLWVLKKQFHKLNSKYREAPDGRLGRLMNQNSDIQMDTLESLELLAKSRRKQSEG